MEFYHRHPQMVDSLIMIGTSARFLKKEDATDDFPSNPLEATLKAWIDAFTAAPRDCGIGFAFSQYPEAKREDYPAYVAEAIQDILSVSPEVFMTTVPLDDQRSYYEEVECPIMLVHGEVDFGVNVGAAKWAYATVKSGMKKLAVYEGVGHVPHVSNADRFNADMAEFLAGLK